MRGKALLRERRHCVVGITPAYAGKREFTSGRCIALGDHPRICGEKRSATFSLTTIKGSPPHMRGKVTWDEGTGEVLGITPAYAGKSCYNTLAWLSRWDHPRICGEKA